MYRISGLVDVQNGNTESIRRSLEIMIGLGSERIVVTGGASLISISALSEYLDEKKIKKIIQELAGKNTGATFIFSIDSTSMHARIEASKGSITYARKILS